MQFISMKSICIPKGHFKPTSFRSKKLDDHVTLVFGHLKEKYASSSEDEEEGNDSRT